MRDTHRPGRGVPELWGHTTGAQGPASTQGERVLLLCQEGFAPQFCLEDPQAVPIY